MSNILVVLFISGGLFFFLIGTIGVLRFPDALTRAHGAAKCDTLGALLCLVGLMIYTDSFFTNVKILLIILFLWNTNPASTHAIAKAITHSKLLRRER